MRMRKLLIVLLLLLKCTSLKAEAFVVNQNCTEQQKSLGLCLKVVDDLKNENRLLNQKVIVLEKQRDDAQDDLVKASAPPLLPVWSWFVIGGVVGGAATLALSHH